MTTLTPAAGGPPPAAVARPALRRRRRRRDNRALALAVLALVAPAVAFTYAKPPAAPVVWPLLALFILALIYVAAMMRRDHRVPVFELGSMFVLVVTVYGAIPLVNYLAAGLSWGAYGDSRLVQYDP